jgi:murein DD-endopeptidase MepM/ murein hydrolase activator NlpD
VLADIEHRDDDVYRVIFEAEPIPAEIRNAGFGGVDRYNDLEGLMNSDLLIQTTQNLDKIAKKMYIQSKSFDDVVKLANNKSVMLASIPAIQPISNKNLKSMTSGFGYRTHPIYKTTHLHAGMDFSSPVGSPIYATGDGIVEAADNLAQGYGNHVVINHNYGYKTLYGHMSRFAVKRGQKVKRGDIIGYVGTTGRSTGNHLHYEEYRNGKNVTDRSGAMLALNPTNTTTPNVASTPAPKINGSQVASASQAQVHSVDNAIEAAAGKPLFSPDDLAAFAAALRAPTMQNGGGGLTQVTSVSKATPYERDFYEGVLRTVAL